MSSVSPLDLVPYCEIPECGEPAGPTGVLAYQEGPIDYKDPAQEKRSLDDLYMLCHGHYRMFLQPRQITNAEWLREQGVPLRPIGTGIALQAREASQPHSDA